MSITIKKVALMTKNSTILGAALATVLLTSCATNEANQDTAQGGSTVVVTPREGNSFDIERKAGPEGGLNIPAQRVTPLVPAPSASGVVPASGDSALKVEPLGENGSFIISKEPGAKGGLRIPTQVVTPTFKKPAETPTKGKESNPGDRPVEVKGAKTAQADPEIPQPDL